MQRLFSFFNPKVFIPDNWRPEKGYYQTLALGHYQIQDEDMIDLEKQRNKWVEDHFSNEKDNNE